MDLPVEPTLAMGCPFLYPPLLTRYSKYVRTVFYIYIVNNHCITVKEDNRSGCHTISPALVNSPSTPAISKPVTPIQGQY